MRDILNNMITQLDGDMVRTETVLPNGKTLYAEIKGNAAEEQIPVKSVLIAVLTGLRLSSTFDGELSAFNLNIVVMSIFLLYRMMSRFSTGFFNLLFLTILTM